MFAPYRSPAASYRRVDLETGVATNDPHRLVAMLYDGLLDRIAQARQAMKTGDVSTKGEAIGRAIRILEEGLKASLDPRGGELAANLGALYAYAATRLLQANLRNDDGMLVEVAGLIEPLQQAWQQIGPQARVVGGPATMPAPAMAGSARRAYAA